MNNMEDKEKTSGSQDQKRDIGEMFSPLQDIKKYEAGENAEVQFGGGLTGLMDMSDPIKDVYLVLLKHGDMTMQEIMQEPSLEDKASLSIYVKILVRQGYIERYKDGDVVRYRALAGEKGKKEISEDIWDALK